MELIGNNLNIQYSRKYFGDKYFGLPPVFISMDPESRQQVSARVDAACKVNGLLDKCTQRAKTLMRRFRERPEDFPIKEMVKFPVDSQGKPDPHDGFSIKWLEARYVLMISPIDMISDYGDTAYDIYTVFGADGANLLWGDTVVWAMRDGSVKTYAQFFEESARFYDISLETYLYLVQHAKIHSLKGEIAQMLQTFSIDSVASVLENYDFISRSGRAMLCNNLPPVNLLNCLEKLTQDNEYKKCKAKLEKEFAKHRDDNSAPLVSERERTDLPPKMPKMCEEVGLRFIEDESDEEDLSAHDSDGASE